MKNSSLGFDMLYEILSRTPLKTMTCCRLLSQQCNSLSYESNFMNLHCQRTNTIAGFFIQTLNHNYYYSTFVSIDNSSALSLDFLPDHAKNIQILACTDGGLILCENTLTRPEEEYYICKPSRKQFETLPNPSPGFTVKVGLTVLRLNPLKFKVVRVFEPDIGLIYKYEVFDSENWEWKPSRDLSLPFSESLIPQQQLGAFSAYGGLHWLTMSRKNMLSFFQDKESWELVPLPESSLSSKTDDLFCSVRTRLTKYDGKLGVIYEKSQRKGTKIVELWIMKKDCNGKRVWSKKHELNFEACNEQIRDCPVLCFYNPDVVLMTGFGFVIFYNFKTGRFERVELDSIYRYDEDAVFVQTDVEPINLKAG